jgi:hypothetical protein
LSFDEGEEIEMAKNTTIEHSPKYEMVLMFYIRKAWNIKKVRDAVIKGWIAKAEFKEITGEDYTE